MARNAPLLIAGCVLACVSAATAASAAPITLTFEGAGNEAFLQGFYSGGTDSAGYAGPDYGVTFNAGVLAVIDDDAGGTGRFANEPSPDTIITYSGFQSFIAINVADGFINEVSFYYGSGLRLITATVYDGLNGTGTALSTVTLVENTSRVTPCAGDPGGDVYCNWDLVTLAFAGTAKSLVFTERFPDSTTFTRLGALGFDNVTFEPAAATVPEPASLLLLTASLLGAGARWRQQYSRQRHQ
jgi:hypothetical protein